MRNCCLQRILEGLPLRAVIETDHVNLLDRARGHLLGRIHLNDSPGDRCGDAFSATLEVARGGELLPEAVLLQKSLLDWLQDPDAHARLLLDQDQHGEPLFEPVRLDAECIIESRPVLFEECGTAAWKLALSLPCHSIRIYQLEADGHWLMTEEIVKSERKSELARPGNECCVQDRYTRLIDSIPSHPVARSGTVRNFSKCLKTPDWWQFSLDLHDRDQNAFHHGKAMIQERRK